MGSCWQFFTHFLAHKQQWEWNHSSQESHIMAIFRLSALAENLVTVWPSGSSNFFFSAKIRSVHVIRESFLPLRGSKSGVGTSYWGSHWWLWHRICENHWIVFILSMSTCKFTAPNIGNTNGCITKHCSSLMVDLYMFILRTLIIQMLNIA